MARATLVFTGGLSLFEARRALHPSVHAFPSGVDVAHFAPARRAMPEPADQSGIGSPRIGFFGVLGRAARPGSAGRGGGVAAGLAVRADRAGGQARRVGAAARGRTCIILGPKSYDDLPGYIAHWDVAMMPFALNEATRFISPTKTPEYLAAGRPVVSTPVADVARSWGATGYVAIAGDAASFMAAADAGAGVAAGGGRRRQMCGWARWRGIGCGRGWQALIEAERARDGVPAGQMAAIER